MGSSAPAGDLPRIREWIRSRRDELVATVRALVATPSENPPADYGPMRAAMERLYREAGLETSVLEGRPGKPNVIGLWPGRGGPGSKALYLTGHMDVVPAGPRERWGRDPFGCESDGTWLHGRGTADMKGALAAEVLAVRALRQAGAKLSGTLVLAATVDDETAGDSGMKYLVEKGLREAGLPRPDFHIVGEGSELDVMGCFKGRVWAEAVVLGKAAHGGDPDRGANAIEGALRLVEKIRAALRGRHPLLGADTLNLGTIQGGEQVNVVPDLCSLRLDLRFGPPATAETAISAIREAGRLLSAENPALRLGELSVLERRDPREVEEGHPAIALLSRCFEELGLPRRPSFRGVLSAGDLYHSLSASIPGVFFGPGSLSVAHTPEERVRVDELVEAALVYAAFIRAYCGEG